MDMNNLKNTFESDSSANRYTVECDRAGYLGIVESAVVNWGVEVDAEEITDGRFRVLVKAPESMFREVLDGGNRITQRNIDNFTGRLAGNGGGQDEKWA